MLSPENDIFSLSKAEEEKLQGQESPIEFFARRGSLTEMSSQELERFHHSLIVYAKELENTDALDEEARKNLDFALRHLYFEKASRGDQDAQSKLENLSHQN